MSNPELIPLLERLKEYRLEKEAVEEDIQATQEHALPLLKADDPEGEGIDCEAWGVEYTAKVQQNRTPEMWDLENLIPWLVQQGLWSRVCTEILDESKLQAEIQSGKIRKSDLKRFTIKGDPPKPFIRFDQKKKKPRVIRVRKRR